jgi:hypothetical protein
MIARNAAEVVDWRRRVFALYSAVRRAADPEEAHELWRIERDDLMARHPATPMLSADRVVFEGLPIAPYDSAWRFELPILPTQPGGFEFSTGTDGVVPFERVGVVGTSSTRSKGPTWVPTPNSGRSCSTSTSHTTLRGPTIRLGHARSRCLATSCP